jgi:peptide-methionine (S)-S-oxide reductase
VRTRVGYTGGTKKNPTYYNLGDQTESIQIDFDPKKITYKELLEHFWKAHNPCSQSGVRQYMSAVWYHNDEQKKIALQTRDAEAARLKQKIVTPVLPKTDFHLAEDYHQKYYLRQNKDLMKEFSAIYPKAKDFLASTAAARVNSYVAGKGKYETLEKEIGNYGLSEQGRKLLLELRKTN